MRRKIEFKDFTVLCVGLLGMTVLCVGLLGMTVGHLIYVKVLFPGMNEPNPEFLKWAVLVMAFGSLLVWLYSITLFSYWVRRTNRKEIAELQFEEPDSELDPPDKPDDF